MKFLKYFLIALVVLVAGFFLIGVFMPSFSYETKITVAKPADEAFAIFNDTSRMGEWLTGFKSIETVSGNPNEVGSQYKLMVEDRGEEMVLMEELTAFRENELFAFKLESDVLTTDATIMFDGQNGHTDITSTNHVVGNNAFWRSLLPLFKSSIAERAQGDYNKLKEVIESTEMDALSDNVE